MKETSLHETALPAAAGGRPVRPTPLPYARQAITESDVAAVVEVLRSDWLTTGPKVEALERALADRVGAAHAVAFSSGTAALHAAAFAAELGPGDEAIVTPLTFCATANCILYQRAQPVFADIDRDSLNLDPAAAAACITPRTKAIFATDYAGTPADIPALEQLAGSRRLVVIEDACHALGARRDGRPVGSLADMTVFSFHPVKHITSGEGGAVSTQSETFAHRLRLFRNHGIVGSARERQDAGRWQYEMVALGYNYRLPDIGCALALSQLGRLDANLAQRRAIAAHYKVAFAAQPAVELPAAPAGTEPAWHLFPLRLRPERLNAGRDEIFQALRAENIGVNVHYMPVYLHPYYSRTLGLKPGLCPRAEAAFATLISLPMYHAMSDGDVADVVAAVEKVLAYYAR